MGPSNKAKRTRAPTFSSRSPTPLVVTGQKISTAQLLSEDRANELRELVQMLLDTFDEAPQALLTLSKRVGLHPDPKLVKHVEAWCRDARIIHCDFLENGFIKTFPTRLPAIIEHLMSNVQPTTQNHILQEARVLKDRCERAICLVHRISKLWHGIELSLRERAKLDTVQESEQWLRPTENTVHAATVGLLSHVLLIHDHLQHLESLLQRFVEFWTDYLLHLGPIDLYNDAQGVNSWGMLELFEQAHIRSSSICSQLLLSHPTIHRPTPKFVKYD